MPYTSSRSLLEAERMALVLAFGRLSILEACTLFEGSVTKAESPCDRVCVVTLDISPPDRLAELAGVHKCAPVVSITSEPSSLKELVDVLAGYLEEKTNLSLSGYGLDDEEYGTMARSLLDGVRAAGYKKVRLMRPAGNELQSEQVISRRAVDVVAFPYHEGFALGPTTWVPDSTSKRIRQSRPVRHPEISMSPRLARVLVNLAGLHSGQTILDPFCGTGTILTEALLQSFKCLGIDASTRMVQETRKNLLWYTGGEPSERWDVRTGDATRLYRALRGEKVDAIVSEPVLLPMLHARPSVAVANEMLGESAEVYSGALASMRESLTPSGRVVIVVPVVTTVDGEEVSLHLDGRKLGLKLHQPGPVGFDYPIRLSFESTRWVRRGVYVFESTS